MSDDDRDFHIDINIKGVWNVTKAVLPEMIARKDGRIVMMSSVTGDMVADPGAKRRTP
ncbi:SDR family NAD(P)-dependent oxidoreductase [Escherichia coli]